MMWACKIFTSLYPVYWKAPIWKCMGTHYKSKIQCRGRQESNKNTAKHSIHQVLTTSGQYGPQMWSKCLVYFSQWDPQKTALVVRCKSDWCPVSLEHKSMVEDCGNNNWIIVCEYCNTPRWFSRITSGNDQSNLASCKGRETILSFWYGGCFVYTASKWDSGESLEHETCFQKKCHVTLMWHSFLGVSVCSPIQYTLIFPCAVSVLNSTNISNNPLFKFKLIPYGIHPEDGMEEVWNYDSMSLSHLTFHGFHIE